MAKSYPMMNWTDKRCLVTGAGGFIGSHLTARLVELGAKVRAVVRYNSRNDLGLLELLPDAVKAALEVRAGDLTDPFWAREAAAGCEIIFHLAALIAIPYSYTAPQQFLAVNGTGTLNLLEAARGHGVERFVHTSTSETYGTAQYTPMDEKHPLVGQSPYAASKIAADKLVESYHLAFGVPAATIRPFNTYGPGQSARAVIPTIISQALAGDTIRLGLVDPGAGFDLRAGYRGGLYQHCRGAQGRRRSDQRRVGGGGVHRRVADLVVGLVGGSKTIIRDEARVRPPASEVMELLCDNRKAGSSWAGAPRPVLKRGWRPPLRFIREHRERYKPESLCGLMQSPPHPSPLPRSAVRGLPAGVGRLLQQRYLVPALPPENWPEWFYHDRMARAVDGCLPGGGRNRRGAAPS